MTGAIVHPVAVDYPHITLNGTLTCSSYIGTTFYHSVDMNEAIALVNRLKGYLRITQVTSKF